MQDLQTPQNLAPMPRRTDWRNSRTCSDLPLLLVALGSLVLASCDKTSNSAENAVGKTDKMTSADASDGANEKWAVPASASHADRAAIRTWFATNELCQGSSDVATIARQCPRRDKLANRLERRGWCWVYQDWTVSRVDYGWHRCSQTTLPADQRSVQADKPAGTVSEDFVADPATGRHEASGLPPEHDPPGQSWREDARAAILEDWQSVGPSIHRAALALSCGIVDKVTAELAIQNIELAMQNQLGPAGLIDDQTMSPAKFARRFVDSGQAAARSDGCVQLTPAMRGHLRAEVGALAQ